MPDGTVMVLVQSGSVRLIRGDVLLPAPALTMSLSPCNGGERGLLGVAVDPDFKVNGFVYLYFTRPSPGSPGGCVNRVSRFTMTGDTIDPNSEVILVDNISSNAGNHNGGDLEIGGDGFLYISVGDAGADPRGDSSPNNAAQDLSLLNGKILRVVPSTGEPAPGNPISGPGTDSCRVRGNTAVDADDRLPGALRVGPAQPVPLRLRSQHRARSVLHQRRRAEHARRGRPGRHRRCNYGWPIREGVCPIGQNPPCAAGDRRVHRPAHRLPAQRWSGHHRRRVHPQRPLAGGVRRRLPVRRRRQRQHVAAPTPTARSTTPRRSPPTSAASPTWRSSPTNDSIALYYTMTGGAGPQDHAGRPSPFVATRAAVVRRRSSGNSGARHPACRAPATSACGPTPRATCRWVSTPR